MEKMSMSNEDYLEAIVMLGGTTKQAVRSVDIANHMGVSKASVNKAVSYLKENGYVEQPFYGGITLTATGQRYGRAIYKRHRYLTTFLSKELGISPEVAEKEACTMEHAISDSSFKKWVAYIDGLGIMEDD